MAKPDELDMFELDLDQEVVVQVPLEVNDAAADELGPGEDKDNAIHQEEFRGAYSSIRIPPLRFGALKDASTGKSFETTVIILDLTFHSSSPERYRFRRAKFSVTLVGSDEQSVSPSVLAFAPVAAYGAPTSYTTRRGWTFELADPVWSSLKANYVSEVTVERKGRFAILGSERGSPSDRVVWTMNEGAQTETGLPLNVKTAVLVSAAASCKLIFDIETDVGFIQGAFRKIADLWSGARSKSVYLDFPKLRAKQQQRGLRDEVFEVSKMSGYTSFSQAPSD